jgi:parvulin-like peptidyl-prolyl isomerase
MKTMNRFFVVILAVAASFRAAALEVDALAAKIGTETILKSDVVNEMQRRGEGAEKYAEVLEAMIDHKLILKAALESKMTMQNWVIENRIREIIKKAFGGDRNKLMATLAMQKISYPEWAAKMKEDMIVAAMRWNVIDKNAQASPSEMRKEYEENPSKYSAEKRVTVSVILLKPEDASKRDEIRAMLRDIDFAQLAKRYSADSHAAEGGLWKDVKCEEVFNSAVCKEIAAMPRGTIGQWVEIDGWNFLLRKEDETGGVKRSFLEAYDDIERAVIEKKAKKMYDAWMSRLRKETYVKVY